MGALLSIAEAAGEAQDAAAVASAQSLEEFGALTPIVLAELNLSAAAWFGAHLGD
jgi:EAL and modified HD-GYP domain-containing signal transduction protein